MMIFLGFLLFAKFIIIIINPSISITLNYRQPFFCIHSLTHFGTPLTVRNFTLYKGKKYIDVAIQKIITVHRVDENVFLFNSFKLIPFFFHIFFSWQRKMFEDLSTLAQSFGSPDGSQFILFFSSIHRLKSMYSHTCLPPCLAVGRR